jgi:hypothetical protein
LLRTGHTYLAALNGGYQVAFLVAVLFAAGASALGAVFLRVSASSQDESRSKQRVSEEQT